MTDLTTSGLRELVLALGADLCGVADLAPGQELVLQLGGELTIPYPRAVSISVALRSAIVNQLDRPEDRKVALASRSHGYDYGKR